MSDSELRAAAERIRKVRAGADPWQVYDGKPGSGSETDEDAIVSAYLAEHPADSDQPAAWPWLGNLGFVDTGDVSRLTPNCWTIDWTIDVTSNPGGSVLWLNDTPVTDDPTRGHVRRLLAALGVPLKETTNG